MRVLATFAGGTGHFLPTLPYARQLRARGHQVRYACQQAMVAVVEDAGFPAVHTGGATLLPPDDRRPLSPVDRAHEQRLVANLFAARIGTERAARNSALIADRRPELVLRDEMEVGAGVAAEAAVRGEHLHPGHQFTGQDELTAATAVAGRGQLRRLAERDHITGLRSSGP